MDDYGGLRAKTSTGLDCKGLPVIVDHGELHGRQPIV